MQKISGDVKNKVKSGAKLTSKLAMRKTLSVAGEKKETTWMLIHVQMGCLDCKAGKLQ